MKKVVLVTPMLQPYRVSFYEKLSEYDKGIDWTILHGISLQEDGKPNYKGQTSFKEIGFILSKIKLGPFTIRYNDGMYKRFCKIDPDIVIIQSITGNLSYRKIVNWTRRNNKTLILWTCGWEPGIAKGLLLKFKNFLASIFYRKADYHLTYSTVASKYSQMMGVDANKIEVCYNGIELDKMIENEAAIISNSQLIRNKLELTNHYTFLYVGGLLPQKKLDMLIDAFAELRKRYENIKLLIIGDGPLKDQLLRKLELINDNKIMYLGRILSESDFYFMASDCLVMPGTGGLALNQAMFWRKICIVGEADGTEDDLIFDGKTGFRFEKDNINSLIYSMERSIKLTQQETQEIGNAARELIKNKSNVNSMVEVFITTVRKFLDT